MPTTIQGVTLFSVMEAAKELRVSKNTIHKWIKSGKLTAHKIGKPYYITQESIRQQMGPLIDDKAQAYKERYKQHQMGKGASGGNKNTQTRTP